MSNQKGLKLRKVSIEIKKNNRSFLGSGVIDINRPDLISIFCLDKEDLLCSSEITFFFNHLQMTLPLKVLQQYDSTFIVSGKVNYSNTTKQIMRGQLLFESDAKRNEFLEEL